MKNKNRKKWSGLKWSPNWSPTSKRTTLAKNLPMCTPRKASRMSTIIGAVKCQGIACTGSKSRSMRSFRPEPTYSRRSTMPLTCSLTTKDTLGEPFSKLKTTTRLSRKWSALVWVLPTWCQLIGWLQWCDPALSSSTQASSTLECIAPWPNLFSWTASRLLLTTQQVRLRPNMASNWPMSCEKDTTYAMTIHTER